MLHADQIFFLQLSGAQVVPPSGSSATGWGQLALTSASDQIAINVGFSGLGSAFVYAAIHGPAPAGSNAPVLFPLTHTPSTSMSGTSGGVFGTFTITAAQATDLDSSKWYVEVDSADFPNGEIRAQLVAGQALPAQQIVPGMTGNWYNPNQSGQGFAIEVLPTNPPELDASWFVFTPMGTTNSGQQAWIGGLGTINGDYATLPAFQVSGPGALFPPNFNEAQASFTPWGTLTFIFSDCNHGHVHWTSTAPGYPASGDLDLVRLTLPAGLTCP